MMDCPQSVNSQTGMAYARCLEGSLSSSYNFVLANRRGSSNDALRPEANVLIQLHIEQSLCVSIVKIYSVCAM